MAWRKEREREGGKTKFDARCRRKYRKKRGKPVACLFITRKARGQIFLFVYSIARENKQTNTEHKEKTQFVDALQEAWLADSLGRLIEMQKRKERGMCKLICFQRDSKGWLTMAKTSL